MPPQADPPTCANQLGLYSADHFAEDTWNRSDLQRISKDQCIVNFRNHSSVVWAKHSGTQQLWAVLGFAIAPLNLPIEH